MLRNIQAARAIAALCVVAYHLELLRFGQCGVDVFFVISGFIMSYVAPLEGRAFFIKRVIRIVPLYWILTVGVYAIALVKPQWLNTTTDGMAFLLKSLFFLPYIKDNGNWGPLLRNGWTLNFEMFFYVLIAVSLLCVRARYATLAGSALLVGICSFVALHGTGNAIADYMGQPLALEFCLGVACYWISRSNIFARVNPGVWAALGIAGVAAIVLLYAMSGNPVGFVRLTHYGLPAFAIILSLLGLEKTGFSVRGNLLVDLGAASYSIYLLHPYVIGAVEKLLHIRTGSATAVSMAASALSIVVVCVTGWWCYRYIESPIQAAIKRARFRARGPVSSAM
ncbi:acyltransferase [Paraburkholderia sp.]|uniref:acyltransferase family protein n=1 Tax=Paraburkholderia sp. TaxID=1926495 RepID=UPI0023873EBE|nr:acyltransferase [Paraburkholderia sp.]MDE1180808.1 acyltransferase [Paraburkholderia sp.]